MRDPAVRALYAVHLTPDEFASVLLLQPVRRKFWPPQKCQGVVVGLCARGRVFGEAMLERAESDHGGALWHFGPVTLYSRPLPHPASVGSRAMASPMPEAPAGTLSPAREAAFQW